MSRDSFFTFPQEYRVCGVVIVITFNDWAKIASFSVSISSSLYSYRILNGQHGVTLFNMPFLSLFSASSGHVTWFWAFERIWESHMQLVGRGAIHWLSGYNSICSRRDHGIRMAEQDRWGLASSTDCHVSQDFMCERKEQPASTSHSYFESLF